MCASSLALLWLRENLDDLLSGASKLPFFTQVPFRSTGGPDEAALFQVAGSGFRTSSVSLASISGRLSIEFVGRKPSNMVANQRLSGCGNLSYNRSVADIHVRSIDQEQELASLAARDLVAG